MFERFTEPARRSIFFARYEASQFGSEYIEPSHFLLGLLREDRALRSLLPSPAREQIRGRIEEREPKRAKVSTSVDLPLSPDTKRAIAYAAEEAEQLQHDQIECGHLMLGLLRLEPSVAREMLEPHGLGYDSMKTTVSARPADVPPKPRRQDEPEFESHDAPHPLNLFVSGSAKHLDWIRESDAAERLKLGTWTRKQAMGHLIDYATAHHQWISRALVEARVVGSGYPAEDRVAAQKYDGMPWRRLVRFWVALNHLIGYVILQVPAEKKQTPCKIGVADEVPLETLIERYISYVEGLVAQILMKG